MNFLAVSLGAILGANLRYVLSRYAAKVMGPVFPYGTLIINIVGSFIAVSYTHLTLPTILRV